MSSDAKPCCKPCETWEGRHGKGISAQKEDRVVLITPKATSYCNSAGGKLVH